MTNIIAKNIKNLITDLNSLYNNTYQLNIHLSDKPYTFTVLLKGLDDRPDCKLSSFGANIWTRTRKGTRYEKYNSISSLQGAIKRTIKSKIDTEGEIKFSLTNEISYL